MPQQEAKIGNNDGDKDLLQAAGSTCDLCCW